MKRLTLASILMLIVMLVHAQSTPEAFLALLPAVPTIDCSTESSRQDEAIAAFQSQITATRDKLSERIRAEKPKNRNLQLSENVKGQALTQSGLSESELNKAANKKTPSAERDRLTDKSVQNQTGFSMEEMQQVKKMSKADRQKWAMENYGKVVQTEKQKAADTKPYQAQNASTMATLAAEQQQLSQNLQQHFNRLSKMKTDLETSAVQQQVILERKLKEIELQFRDVNDGEGSTKADMEKLRQKNRLMRQAKTEYCSKLTPLQITYLTAYESALKENILPDLKRTAEIECQMQNATTGKAEESNVGRLRAIQDYAGALSGAYKYYLSVNKD